MAPDDALRGEIVKRLRALHALKAGALRMFDPMLASVSKARDNQGLAEVEDLLGRMHGNFSRHREVTADHAGKLAVRLEELGAAPSRAKAGAVGAGSAARAYLGAIGGMDFGASARDAFVFEHLEISLAHLLEQLAARAGDEVTAATRTLHPSRGRGHGGGHQPQLEQCPQPHTRDQRPAGQPAARELMHLPHGLSA